MQIDIRPYDAADFEAVIRIWFDSRRSTGLAGALDATMGELQLRFIRDRAAGCVYYTATDGDEIVGFIGLNGDVLDKLYVAPARQGQGIGARMLDFVKSLRPGGFRLVTAERNPACDFYEREGLHATERFAHPQFPYDVVRYEYRPRRRRPAERRADV